MAYLRLRSVSVDLPMYQGSSRSLKKSLLATSSRGNFASDALQRLTVRALNDVTVDIEEGARLGVIGPNGAGKSTLLRVLSSIHRPSHGRILKSGRVTSLLDVSVGMDPEATGLENIILRGMYLGFHPKEMRQRIPEIAEFSELGDYLQLPVRTYSSGMMIRLAFAVSTSFEPEILVMDEWLTVGDARFLAKAQKRLEQYVRGSRILVLATHSMPLVEEWCNRAILLDQGHVVASGDVKEVVEAYRARW